MAQTTLYRLAEQALRIYKGKEKANQNVRIEEVKLLVNQVTHTLLATSIHHQQKAGDIDIPECIIATYKNVSVSHNTTYNETTATLPVTPLQLRYDLGVYKVYDKRREYDAFIPIPNYAVGIIDNLPSGFMEGQIGYKTEGNRIEFSENITKKGIVSVCIKLLVINPDELDENDPYPIPPELEAEVITRVVDLLSEKPEVVDNTVDGIDQV